MLLYVVGVHDDERCLIVFLRETLRYLFSYESRALHLRAKRILLLFDYDDFLLLQSLLLIDLKTEAFLKEVERIVGPTA